MAGGAAKTVLRAVQWPHFSCAIMKSFGSMSFTTGCPSWRQKNENLTTHQRIILMVILVPIKDFFTFLSKITKYNRVHFGSDPAVVRLLGHDPTPRPTCLVFLASNTCVGCSIKTVLNLTFYAKIQLI